MFNLSSHLDKLKGIKNPQEGKNTLALIVSQIINHPVSGEDIIVSSKGILSVQGSAPLKSLVFINKEALLEKIKEEASELDIKGISN
jgi:hypothetical protein